MVHVASPTPVAQRTRRIFFSAGEPSGDHHGASLIRALRERDPDIEIVGYGGPLMEEAGCRLHADLTQLAVMWILHALLNIHKFWGLYRRAARYFRDERPDAVVLIDYPGFNWWIASAAKRRGVPVIYYCPPQLWAWLSYRIRKMRRYVDLVLCNHAFEETWFRERGVRTSFVGHPFLEDATNRTLEEQFSRRVRGDAGRLIVLLPGSRTQEVKHNFRDFLRVAQRVGREREDVRFAVAAFKPRHAEMIQAMIKEFGDAALASNVEVYTAKTPELIHAADCALAVSGSVSLELLAAAKPTVIQYRVSRFAFFLQRFVRHTKYITLVNLLAEDRLETDDISLFDPEQENADAVPFPEYLTCVDQTPRIAKHLLAWINDDSLRAERVALLGASRDRVARGGASSGAADKILEEIAAD